MKEEDRDMWDVQSMCASMRDVHQESWERQRNVLLEEWDAEDVHA